jgi:23S rRNA (cytidine1920-2'-O)/16S rRNA (cytidine1409-2'-O)-methyltransferase
MKKERLDTILVNLGYFDNKSKAAAAILSGSVKINDEVITKAGFQIDPEKKLEVEIKSMPYVSRGGFKLKKALETFDIIVKDRICIDAGASTGGFSDCLLQNGAKKVYAADVGYGQLAWKIRSDARVKTIERTNIKNCAFNEIYAENDEIADLLVMDVSFISIEKVLPNLKKLLKPDFHELICLIKPQFEAGKALVDKGGVVKDKNVHIDVINHIINFAKKLGYKVIDLASSPIKGPSGNIEYLIYLATEGTEKDFSVEGIVGNAF